MNKHYANLQQAQFHIERQLGLINCSQREVITTKMFHIRYSVYDRLKILIVYGQKDKN